MGAPGASHLGTWDIDTMQGQTSIRVPDTCMTLPLACLLSAASAHPSISTGKERDTESGNDYFPARYFASSTGRFLSADPDNDSAFSHPGDPQAWNGYAYGRNNPLANVDPGGDDYYLVGGSQCGQNGVNCDNGGYVLGSDGNRQVVTDAQTQNGGATLSQGANGGVNVTTGQGTFAGQFFDASPNVVSATVSADPSIAPSASAFINQTNAYNQAAMPLLGSTAITTAGVAGLMILGPENAGVAAISILKSSAQRVKNLHGLSKVDARAELEKEGFKPRGVTPGGYEKWYAPDGSKVLIGPDGEVDRIPPGGGGWRVNSDGNIRRPHSFEPETIDIGPVE